MRVVTRDDAGEVTRTALEVPQVAGARPSGSDGGVSQVDVVLDTNDREAGEAAIEDLRSALAPYDDTHVTGTLAIAVDTEAAAARDQQVIIPMILLLVMIGLVLLLRSLLAPVLLVASVVLTYRSRPRDRLGGLHRGLRVHRDGQRGAVARLLVPGGPRRGLQHLPGGPGRARRLAEHGTRRGMLRALASTGGVITSAGVLLAAVFASLGVLPLVVLAQLGIVIFIGVLLDTLLVRTVLVPALAQWLGDASGGRAGSRPGTSSRDRSAPGVLTRR